MTGRFVKDTLAAYRCVRMQALSIGLLWQGRDPQGQRSLFRESEASHRPIGRNPQWSSFPDCAPLMTEISYFAGTSRIFPVHKRPHIIH